jgi:4-amino-4-deoxy-L-arabinose transferase-like glycosyltransferase
MLALNIASRSALELLRPLDYNQTAPPLFLWVERLAVRLGGVTEAALRAWPLLAGILLLALVWPVARRLAGTAAALAAVALAAFSPTLIRYTDEVKPYGTDALMTAAVLLAALSVARDGSRRSWLALGAIGPVSLLVSIPATFVLAGTLVALALHPAVRRDRLRALGACALVWAAAAVLLYVLYYRRAATNPHQHEGYGFAFVTPGPGFAKRVGLATRGTILPAPP